MTTQRSQVWGGTVNILIKFSHMCTRELSTSIPIHSNYTGTLLDLPSTPVWVSGMNKATKALAEMGQATTNTMFSVVENNQNGTEKK